MALVIRNGRIYKYKYKRVKGKVKRIYDGKGDAALFGGLIEQEAIEEREYERQQLQQWRGEQTELYRAEEQRGRGILAISTIVLESQGFRRYSRNPWKRRLMKAPPDSTTKEPEAGVKALIPDLVTRIIHGDSEAVEQIRQLSSKYPHEVIASFDIHVERLAESEFAHGESKKNDTQCEIIATMRLTAADLAGEKPSPAVRLCASAAAFAWIEHWLLNMRSAANHLQDDSVTIRRRNAAQKRYMVSLRTLAQIKKAESLTRRADDDASDWIARFGSRAQIGG